MADTLIGIAVFAWAPFGSVIVGVLYFLASSKNASAPRRVLAAAYAPLAAGLYLAAGLLPLAARSKYIVPVYPMLQVIPVGLLLYSLIKFPGPKWAHAVLLPIALVCVAWQAVWGYFFIYGK